MKSPKCILFSFTSSLSKETSKRIFSSPARYSNCNYSNSKTRGVSSSCAVDVCVYVTFKSMSMLEPSTGVSFRTDRERASFLRRGRIMATKGTQWPGTPESTFSEHAEVTSLNLPADSFPLGSQLFIHTDFDYPTCFIFNSSFIFRPFHIRVNKEPLNPLLAFANSCLRNLVFVIFPPCPA